MSEPSQRADGQRPGLFDSLRALLANLIAIGHNRLELLTTELQEEITRVAYVLLWGFVALMLAGIGLVMIAVAIVLVFWDTHPVLAASLLALAFFAGAIGAAVALTRRVQSKPRLFDASLLELADDRDRLSSTPRSI